jgi:hypothetical protein
MILPIHVIHVLQIAKIAKMGITTAALNALQTSIFPAFQARALQIYPLQRVLLLAVNALPTMYSTTKESASLVIQAVQPALLRLIQPNALLVWQTNTLLP